MNATRHPFVLFGLVPCLMLLLFRVGCASDDGLGIDKPGDDVSGACFGIPIDDPDHECNGGSATRRDVFGGEEGADARDPISPLLNCAERAQEDEDGDGIMNELEDLNLDCRHNAGETDWQNADTDGDGLEDGEEDRNQNGIRDAGEFDPRMPDTDEDGVPDGRDRRPDSEQPRDHCVRDRDRCLPPNAPGGR